MPMLKNQFRHFSRSVNKRKPPIPLMTSKSMKVLSSMKNDDISDPVTESQKLLRTIDIFLNVKNQNIKSIKNLNFEEYELKNE